MSSLSYILAICLAVFLIIFILYSIFNEIRDNYEDKQEDDYTKELIKEIRTIDPSVDRIVDNLKFFDGGNRSYTINKKYVHLCKVDANGEMYNKNQLVLVLIHEISHALCDEVGHTQKFNQILENLLEKASAKGVYNPNIKSIPDYCSY